MSNVIKVSKYKIFFWWLLIVTFYSFQYPLRIVPSVMVNQIREEFLINAEKFATLGSITLISYALMQIPFGILLDKLGMRKVILPSIVLCLLGNFLTSIAENFSLLQFSRFLIGIGSAPALICALKIVADNLPAGSRGLFTGSILTLGTISAMLFGDFMANSLVKDNWRQVISFFTWLGFIIFILVFIFFHPPERGDKNTMQGVDILQSIKAIISNRNILIYTVVAIGLFSPFAVLSDLWGSAFIMQKYALQQTISVQINLKLYLGIAIGSFTLSWFCERYSLINQGIIVATFITCILISVLILGPVYETSLLLIILFTIGFFCGAEMLCFTGALLHTEPGKSGQIMGVINTLNMLGGAILAQLVGNILDFNWSGIIYDNGNRFYNVQEYEFALSILILLLGVCCFLSLFLRRAKKI